MRLTLWLYIARQFLWTVGAAFLTVLMLVVIVDMVELIRSNKNGRAGFLDLLGMAFLHAPSITITAAPFTILLASMVSFAMLARRSELVVTRAAGVSVWRLITPALVVATLLGVFSFAVYNPIASAFAARFETLEQRYFDRTSSRLAVSSAGLWLRQGGTEGQTVIRAKRASESVQRLSEVLVFQFDENDQLIRRIDARTATLENRRWRLGDVLQWDLQTATSAAADAIGETRAVAMAETRIATDLTVEHILDSFAAPETISFWKLPGFIATLEDSGFASNRHRMHWLGLISAPIVFIAMVLIGAAFSMRHARFGGLGLMALGCVISGFGFFILSDIASALGASGAVPVPVAAWVPPISAMLFALGLLLHLEDG